MSRKRHSREEILRKVRQANIDLAAGISLTQICMEQEIKQATLSRWLREHVPPPEEGFARLRQIEQENRRLRRQIANLEFDKKVLAEAVRGNF